MKKNIILFKVITKHIKAMPILLLSSILMAYAHNRINEPLLTIGILAILLASIPLALYRKGLITWHFKPWYQQGKELGTVLLLGYIILMNPISLIVAGGLMFLQLFYIMVLTDNENEKTPFVKNRFMKLKFSEEEKENFLSKQKSNYPEPDSEMELAIIQNESKIQEVYKKQQELEKSIVENLAKQNKMQAEIEESVDYKYTSNLKKSVEEAEIEKNRLLEKKSELMNSKNLLEKKLEEQYLILKQQEFEKEELQRERKKLRFSLFKQENILAEERMKKHYLAAEQERLKEMLTEKFNEIDQLNNKKSELEEVGERFQEQVRDISQELNRTYEEQKRDKEELIAVKNSIKDYKEYYLIEKQQVDNQLKTINSQKEKVEKDFKVTKEKLIQSHAELNEYQAEKNQLTNDVIDFKNQIEALSREQKKSLVDKNQRLKEIEAIMSEKKIIEQEYQAQLITYKDENETLKFQYENYKNNKEKDLEKLNDYIHNQSQRVEILMSQVKDHERLLTEHELNKSNLKLEIEELQKKIETKNMDLSNYENSLSQLTQEKEEMEQVFTNNKKQLIVLTESIDKYQQAHTSIQEKLEQKDRELEKTKMANQSQQMEIEVLLSKKKEFEGEQALYEEMLKEIDQDAKGLKSEVMEKTKQIDTLQQEIEALQEENEKQNQLLSKLEEMKNQSFKNLKENKKKEKYLRERFWALYPKIGFSDRVIEELASTQDVKLQLSFEKKIAWLHYVDSSSLVKDRVKKTKVSEIEFKDDWRIYVEMNKGKIFVHNFGHKKTQKRDIERLMRESKLEKIG